MEITGEQVIPLPQQQVWDALNDPLVLRQCIPGCERVDSDAEGRFTIAMVAAVGPVKARFSGRLAIRDADPPRSYALSFEGSGGVAGFGKGTAQVHLTADADAVTVLTYRAEATVGGKIAQVGARLVDGVARKLADGFFERFVQVVAPPVAAEQTPEGASAPARRWSLFGRTAPAAEAPAVPPGDGTIP